MPKVKFIKHPAGHNMAYSIGDVVEVNSELAKRLLTHGLIEFLSDTTETATAQTPTETATRNRRPRK